MLIALIFAVLAGVSRTVGRMANARLASHIGLVWSTCANYLMGLLCSLLALYLSWQPGGGMALAAEAPPIWMYLGAVVGVLFVVLSNLVTARMPAFTMSVLLVIGQIAGGMVIDGLVGRTLSFGSLAGGLLILIGLLINRETSAAHRRPATLSTAPQALPADHPWTVPPRD